MCSNPKAIAVGISAQYVIMPLMALTLASTFSLDTALTAGLILVGTVPGGTASDVITFLAKGDVALSVSVLDIILENIQFKLYQKTLEQYNMEAMFIK